MEKIKEKVIPVADLLFVLLLFPSAIFLKYIRRVGLRRLPRCRNTLLKLGVFPIRDHYYEPQFDFRNPVVKFSEDRSLPGINWNVPGQLEILSLLRFRDELSDIPRERSASNRYFLNNQTFRSGDAEYWYQMIRWKKPARIIEIGSGTSTLMALEAIRRNQKEVPEYRCEHICVEPYEMPWLEETGVTVLRKKVEELELSFFAKLKENDILFIDSSHIIRPQGDVLYEYLELLPSLKKGVIVHVHDIFSPKNYPESWLKEDVRFWNEQYLLEAFLTNNYDWKIIGALNYLHHHHHLELKSVAPFLSPDREPGSFYIQKTT